MKKTKITAEMFERLSHDEKELLELISYHRELFEKKMQDGALPGDEEEEIYKSLDGMLEVVEFHALMLAENEKPKTKTIPSYCPDCDTEKPRLVVGVEKDTDGMTYDIFHCKKCKKDFRSEYPNTPLEMMKWYKELLEALEKRKPENVSDETHAFLIQMTRYNFEKTKQLCEMEAKEKEKIAGAKKEYDSIITDFIELLKEGEEDGIE